MRHCPIFNYHTQFIDWKITLIIKQLYPNLASINTIITWKHSSTNLEKHSSKHSFRKYFSERKSKLLVELLKKSIIAKLTDSEHRRSAFFVYLMRHITAFHNFSYTRFSLWKSNLLVLPLMVTLKILVLSSLVSNL